MPEVKTQFSMKKTEAGLDYILYYMLQKDVQQNRKMNQC